MPQKLKIKTGIARTSTRRRKQNIMKTIDSVANNVEIVVNKKVDSPMTSPLNKENTNFQKRRKVNDARQTECDKASSVNISNNFALLTDLEDDENIVSSGEKQLATTRKEKVPPIVVTVPNMQTFKENILRLYKHEVISFELNRNGSCKVFMRSLDAHEKLCNFLNNNKILYFTYDSKCDNKFKVVLKGLPNFLAIDEIEAELKKLLGVNFIRVIKMKTKRQNISGASQLPDLYLVHFNKNEVNSLKSLEKANILFYIRIKWEHFRRFGNTQTNVTQCRNCQRYGHGTKNCHMIQKCMICSSIVHAKDECPVQAERSKFKCANCGGAHKSNDWDCPARKKFLDNRAKNQQRIKNNTGSSKQPKSVYTASAAPILPVHSVPSTPKVPRVIINQNSPSTSNIGKQSYASVAAGKSANHLNFDFPIGLESLNFLPTAMSNMMNALVNIKTMFEEIQACFQNMSQLFNNFSK